MTRPSRWIFSASYHTMSCRMSIRVDRKQGVTPLGDTPVVSILPKWVYTCRLYIYIYVWTYKIMCCYIYKYIYPDATYIHTYTLPMERNRHSRYIRTHTIVHMMMSRTEAMVCIIIYTHLYIKPAAAMPLIWHRFRR